MTSLSILVAGVTMSPEYMTAILRLGNIGAVAFSGTVCVVAALLVYALVT